MKIIHQNGYTHDELLVFRLVVYRNLIESAQAIVRQMRKMGVDPTIPANRVCAALLLDILPELSRAFQSHADRILDYRVEYEQTFILSEDIAHAIHQLWQDPIIQKVMDHSSDFYLMDSAG